MSRKGEIDYRKADLRAAAHDSQDPTLTPTERATATAAMNDHLDALADAGAIRRR